MSSAEKRRKFMPHLKRKQLRILMLTLFICLSALVPVAQAAGSELDAAYFLDDYAYINDSDSVFTSLVWEELVTLLEREGNALILFGGPWCTNTTPVIGYINDVAKESGVETIYTFDFRLDGATADAHVRESNGATKNDLPVSGSLYNY